MGIMEAQVETEVVMGAGGLGEALFNSPCMKWRLMTKRMRKQKIQELRQRLQHRRNWSRTKLGKTWLLHLTSWRRLQGSALELTVV